MRKYEYKELIRKKECFIESNTVMEANNVLHIAFGVDKNYLPPLGVLMTSLVINNPLLKFHFHIFVDEISEKDRTKLSLFVKKYPNISIDVYYFDLFKLESINRNTCIRYPSMCYRIIMPYIIDSTIKKLLYMDADMLCVGSLDELLADASDACILSAVRDEGDVSNKLKDDKEAIGLSDDDDYFNSGILYIDVDKYIANDTADKCYQLLKKINTVMPDQDALNVAVKDRWGKLPMEMNHFYKNDVDLITDNIKIVHYTGVGKPWTPWDVKSVSSKVYDSYRDLSLWNDFTYEPRNTREMRLLARTLWKKGKVKDSLYYYIQYIKGKIIAE